MYKDGPRAERVKWMKNSNKRFRGRDALNNYIKIFTHLKLCLATAIHSFKSDR